MKKTTLMISLVLISFCLKTHAQVPPNDDLVNAIPLIMGASCTNDFYTNTDATAQTSEPQASCFTGATHTVWFSFVAPPSGAAMVTTDILPGDMSDSQIAVYPAPSDPSDLSTLPPEVGCDQDSGELVFNGTSTYMSTLELGGLTAGDTYYVQVDGWNGTTGDFCVQVSAIACPTPSNLQVSNITPSTAEVDWIGSGTAGLWDIEYGAAGFVPTGVPTVEDITNPYTITGLSNNSAYEVYLRTDCGGGEESKWIGPIGFTTICGGLPYVQSFSEGVFPECWTRSSTSDVVVEASCGSRSNVLRFDYSEEAITVSIDASGLTTGLKVSYYIADSVCGSGADTGEMFNVDYWDGTQWVNAKTYDADRPDAYTYESFVVPQGDLSNDFKVRFDQIDGTTDSWFIDELIIQQPPTCILPGNLMATGITSATADLGWTENNTPAATAWDIHVVPAGDPAPISTTTPSDAGVTANPYTASGLSPATMYDFYVRSDCGGGDKSLWVGPYTFTTACAPFGDFYENFDTAATGGMPNCWSVLVNSSSSFSTIEIDDDSGDANSGANYLEYNSSSGNSGDYFAITPQLTALAAGTNQMRFYAKGDTGSSIEVGTLADPTDATSFTVVQTITLTTSYMEYAVPFSTTTTDLYVAFRGIFGSSYDYIELDDVNWEPIPSCVKPSLLTVANVLTTSADLGWTENNTPVATTWDVHIVPAGDPAPTNTTTPSDAGVTANPYSASNLSPGTNYEFYVRTDCGGGDFSIWEGPFAFATNCVTASIPYTESFSSGVFPTCWTRTDASDVSIVATCNSRSNVLNISDTNDVVTGEIDGTSSSNGLKVSYFVGDDLCGGATEDPFEVSYWDGAQWVLAKTYETDAAGMPYDNAYFYDSFLVPQSAVTATFKLQFSTNETINGDNWYIDELVVQQAPTCIPPDNLTATNISGTTADLGWTENNTPAATIWDVHIVPAGDPAPTSATTPTNPGVTTNPYNVSGLSSSGSYDFYVRTDCGGGDLSNWSVPHTFSTLCQTATLPYIESFGSGVFPVCWTRTSTTDVSIEGSCGSRNNVLNISNTNDVTTGEIDGTASTTGLKVSYFIGSDLCGGATEDPFDVSYWDGTQWVVAKTYETVGSSTPYDNAYFYDSFLVPQSAVTATFKLQFSANETINSDNWYIDEVIVQQPPTCILPSNAFASNLTANTAVLKWTDNTGASSWDIEIVPAGTAPTGTPTVSGVTSPYTATGLNPCESYVFYVRADCGGGDLSLYTASSVFSMGSGPVGSFSENFDSVAPGEQPICWTSLINSSGSSTAEVDDFNAFSQPNTFEFYSGSDATPTMYAITPELIDLSLGTHQMRFQARTDANVAFLDIGTMSNPNDESTFKLIQTVATTSNYQEFIVQFTRVTTDSYIAFRATFNKTFEYSNIDDVNWEPIPNPCPAPAAITANNISTTSADLTWTPGGTETEWEIEYGPTGFTVGSGTVILDDDGTLGETISGLSPLTDYDVYVTAFCSSGQRSAQIGPVLLTTLPTPCPSVTNISIVDVDLYSFEVTWDAGGTETKWEIEFGPAGFTPGTGTVVIDGDGIGELITGLDPDTDYEVYVTSLCGQGSEINSNGPKPFTTKGLGVNDQVFEDFTFYPNPVSQTLSLKAAHEIEQVVIFNLLGQKILDIKPSNLAPVLEVGNLQTGTYLMQVTIDGANAVYKFIKE